MIYNEQKLRNKYRTYYHGSDTDTLDISKARYDMLFLTVSPKYAVKYADEEFGNIGYVFSFHLKNEINVFNANCLSDRIKMHKNMEEPSIGWDMFDDVIKNFDWYLLDVKYHISRNRVFKVIKDLGYDGVTQVMEEKFGICDEGYHSIGIFNPDVLVLEKIEDYKTFKKIHKEVETIKDKKITYAECGLYMIDERKVNFTDDELFEFIYQKSGLTEADLQDHKDRILESNRRIEKLILSGEI